MHWNGLTATNGRQLGWSNSRKLNYGDISDEKDLKRLISLMWRALDGLLLRQISWKSVNAHGYRPSVNWRARSKNLKADFCCFTTFFRHALNFRPCGGNSTGGQSFAHQLWAWRANCSPKFPWHFPSLIQHWSHFQIKSNQLYNRQNMTNNKIIIRR